MPARRPVKSYYSEREAARELGVSIDELRDMVRRHILGYRGQIANTRRAIYHPSDLLVLKLLSSRAAAPIAAG